jgi:tight adherence protein C
MPFIAIFFGILVGGVFLCLSLFFQPRQSPLKRRLSARQPSKLDLLKPQMAQSPSFLSLSLTRKLEEKFNLRKDSSRIMQLKQTLARAGIHNERGIPVFLGIKLGCLLVLPLLMLLLLWERSPQKLPVILVTGIICLLGFLLPDLILKHLVQSRQQKIKETLPDALDLLVVCVQAGQGLNAAMKRVAEDLAVTSPIISQEFLMVNLEINAGRNREEALRNLGERTGVDELVSLCNILIQSERFGTSIGQALKTQSETLRTYRRQKLEELAAKTPVKLVFPLILFIFPAIVVVILGPVVIKITEFFRR